jgi:hypothetical protein
MTVASQMQQVEFIDQAMLFQQVNRAVYRDEVHSGIDFFCAIENLIYVQMLFGIVHDLENDSPLARHPDSQPADALRQPADRLSGVDSLAGRSAVRWRSGHTRVSSNTP